MQFVGVFVVLVAAGIVTSSVSAQTRLMLNTKTNSNVLTPTVVDLNSPATVKQSGFLPSRPTKILIHGYLDRYTALWWQQMVSEFLQGEDLNVFRVDWSSSNSGQYPQAVTNVAVVGAQVANFVMYLLSEYHIPAESIHVIGHSLGAHVAGALGEKLKTSNVAIGRITGLDPAGPGYTNTVPTNRLDPTDATVVDTIITDSLILGSPQAMGHINFLPNGGVNQPSCFGTNVCSHLRSATLFTASINNKNGGVYGQQCDSYTNFVQGKCSNQPKSLLGYRTDISLARTPGLNFFSTN